MKLGGPRFFQRSALLAAAGILVAVLTACTGKGGGYLPPQSPVFTGQASLGFTFSCEDKGGLNPPTGQLSIELAYTDRGANPIGSSFGIHGIVETVDPVVESAICIGQNPPPDGSTLIFLGRYRPTTTNPPGPLADCPKRETSTSRLCRFEVTVRDNDKNFAPSAGDYFQIRLSSGTVLDDELDPALVFYTRAGLLAGGNITVK